MDQFDNAIHYGPNDAGASTLSIAVLVLGVLLASWLLGAAYGLIANYINSKKDQSN